VAGCHLVTTCGLVFLELTLKVHGTFWKGGCGAVGLDLAVGLDGPI